VTTGGTVEAVHGAAGGAGGATCGIAVGDTRGIVVVATQGRNPGGTVSAVRLSAGVEVSAVVSQVPMVETMETDSQRKSRLVRLGEPVSGKLSS
jgi:hypothetical protein